MGDDNFDGLSFILWFWGILSALMCLGIMIINTNGEIIILVGIIGILLGIYTLVVKLIEHIKKRRNHK